MNQNLYENIPNDLPEELCQVLAAGESFRLERIVSEGHTSPPEFWYDLALSEWVVLIEGAARLEFEGDEKSLEMRPGDYVLIPAHRRHRVAWTSPTMKTIWLAIYFDT